MDSPFLVTECVNGTQLKGLFFDYLNAQAQQYTSPPSAPNLGWVGNWCNAGWSGHALAKRLVWETVVIPG